MDNKELTIQNTNAHKPARFEDVEYYLDKYIKANALPPHITSPELAYTIINYGRELGFNPIQSLHYITPVKGNLTLNAKGIAHKASEAKLVFKAIHNADYVYFGEGKELISNRILPIDELLHKLDIVDAYKGFGEDKRLRIITPRDRITTLEYGYQMEKGKIEWIGEHSYYWSDVLEAGLDSKDTYKLYPRIMMAHRCKTDICKILGLIKENVHDEIATVEGVSYQIEDINVE